MGWGKKVAAPQPLKPRLDGDAPIDDSAERALPIVDTPVEKPTDAAKAEIAWSQLRSRKGWVPETTAILLYEFVKERGLFAELIVFAKRRR